MTYLVEYMPAVLKPESAELGFEIRRAIFGDYLIYYHINEARHCVEVLYFRHAAHETGGLSMEGDE